MSHSPSMLLAQAMADVAAVLVAGAVLSPLLRRLGQPRVIAEIAAGIALGPSLLGLLPAHLTVRLFPLAARPDLSAIAQVGILLFMFLIGWEMNPADIREKGRAVLGISLASIAAPFATGGLLATWLFHDHAVVNGHHIGRTAFVLFVGTAMAITAFPVLARIILEHRLQLTLPGRLSLASAALGDVLAWCMLAAVAAVAASAGAGSLVRIVGCSVLYALVLGFVVRPLLRALLARMARTVDAPLQTLAVMVAGVFVAGFVTDLIGLDAIFGAFSFGLVMPRDSTKSLRSAVRIPMENITALLLPVFFVTTGLSVNVTTLGGSGVLELLAIVVVASVGKLVGAGGAARLSGLSWQDSRTVGFLMNTRGLTELIILNAGMGMGVLDSRMFTMMVLMALITTAMAGLFVPRLSYAYTHQVGSAAQEEATAESVPSAV